MLAIAISLLFGLAAFVALVAIHAAVIRGTFRARQIMAELEAIEARRSAPVTPGWRQSQPAMARQLVAA